MVGMKGTDAVNAYQGYAAKKVEKKNDSVKNVKESDKSTTRKTDYGKTIGEPKLSDEAAKYYEKLKKKYGKYDFILVSEDQKANAQANASKYASKTKTVVLIDEEKIERMATDESYRKKYEGILSGAASQLQQLKTNMDKTGAAVQGYGMQVNDNGTTSFFAVLKKSSSSQKARIEKAAEKKKTEKKENEKKAARKEKENRAKKAEEKETEDRMDLEDDEVMTISASSLEDLIKKIEDYNLAQRSDSVLTESEKQVGQHIDFRG